MIRSRGVSAPLNCRDQNPDFSSLLSATRMLFISELSLLIQETHFRARGVCLDCRLIHQFHARRRHAKFTWHLHSQRNLESLIPTEIIQEYRRLLITKLPGAIPIRPPSRTGFNIRKIESTDSLNLLAPGGNRILDHHVLRARSFDVKPRHDQIPRSNLPAKWLNLPSRLLAVLNYSQPQILASQSQVRRRLGFNVVITSEITEGARKVQSALAGLHNAYLIGTAELRAFPFNHESLCRRYIRRRHLL